MCMSEIIVYIVNPSWSLVVLGSWFQFWAFTRTFHLSYLISSVICLCASLLSAVGWALINSLCFSFFPIIYSHANAIITSVWTKTICFRFLFLFWVCERFLLFFALWSDTFLIAILSGCLLDFPLNWEAYIILFPYLIVLTKFYEFHSEVMGQRVWTIMEE